MFNKIAILGFGREGKSLLKFIKKIQRAQNIKIEILDQRFDKNYLQNLESFDLIFRSPGVPYNLPSIQKAIKKGVQFSSATQLFFELCPAPIIGVTGTKGKGTTATLLYKILKACGKRVFLAGNIGKTAIDIIPQLTKNSLVVLELSSFQLQDLKKSPAIAVITDIFPDHLDVHKNIREYIEAKSNIVKYQTKSSVVFYFKDNLLSRLIAQKSCGEKIGIAGTQFGLQKNYIMAGAVAAYLGCPQKKILAVIKNFKGLKHRLELVRSIKLPSSTLKNLRISFYNDSASTNPQTAAAAVLSLSQKNCLLILIAGGKDKNLNYQPLAKAIQESGKVKIVILFGENKNKIYRAIRNKKLEIKTANDLNSAVRLAYQKAKFLSSYYSLSVAIVFSPASASFDMFKDYQDRGDNFKAIVKKLK